MQQPANSAPTHSFAGILAAIAAPGQKRPPARDLDGLEDDVARLSYERALRAHAVHKRAEPDSQGVAFVLPPPVSTVLPLPEQPAETTDPGSLRIFEAASAEDISAVAQPVVASSTTGPVRIPPAAQIDPAPQRLGDDFQKEIRQEPRQEFKATDRNLRTVSITIRLNKTECAMVHKRAAEAGISVSAYLRSCTLEAESLRLMVRDTLAKLRAEAAREAHEGDELPARSWFGWLRRFSPNAQTQVREAST